MPAPALGGTFYPACIVNLIIRFDEAFNADWRVADVEDKSVLSVSELRARELAEGKIPSQPARTGIAQMPTGKSLFDVQANVAGSSILGRIPLQASVELNNIRKPGSFNLTFDYKDLPIDPRLVRAVGIEIYMDTVTADSFAQGILSATSKQHAARTQDLNGFVPFKATPRNLVLKGVVDEWSVTHGASGSTVTMSGRDMVGVMLNTPVTPTMLKAMVGKLNAKISDVVRALLATVGTWTDKIDVQAEPDAWWPDGEEPFVANIAPLTPELLLPEEKPQGKTPRARVAVKDGQPRISAGAKPDKLTMWDLITRYCNVVAAVPHFTIAQKEGSNSYSSVLKISPQWGLYDYYRTYLDDNILVGPSTRQFTGRARTYEGSNKLIAVRQLSYGRNIEELTLERKYQGITARAVEVVSYNSSSTAKGQERLLTAISSLRPSYAQQAGASPPVAAANSEVKAGQVPSGLSSQDEVLRVEVKGITDINQLQKLADGLYEEIMRGETGGSVRTRSLASFGGNNEDPDLLRIRPRDPLKLSVDVRTGGSIPRNDMTELIKQVRQDVLELERDLVEKGMDTNLARAVAYSSRNAVAQLQNTFRVNSVTFDWDVKSGIALSIDFHNYIVARDSVLPTPNGTGAAAAKPAVKGSAVRSRGRRRRNRTGRKTTTRRRTRRG